EQEGERPADEVGPNDRQQSIVQASDTEGEEDGKVDESKLRYRRLAPKIDAVDDELGIARARQSDEHDGKHDRTNRRLRDERGAPSHLGIAHGHDECDRKEKRAERYAVDVPVLMTDAVATVQAEHPSEHDDRG